LIVPTRLDRHAASAPILAEGFAHFDGAEFPGFLLETPDQGEAPFGIPGFATGPGADENFMGGAFFLLGIEKEPPHLLLNRRNHDSPTFL
jgi:hypothetical protein